MRQCAPDLLSLLFPLANYLALDAMASGILAVVVGVFVVLLGRVPPATLGVDHDHFMVVVLETLTV